MNFSFDRFLKPLTSSDKNIKIYDNNNVVKYIINPFNVKTLNISNNLITINLESGRNITLDFATQNEAKQAVQKLQLYVDTLKNSLVPYYIQHAVELEAPNFTKGPTGSTGEIGPVGSQGEKGDQGKSAYEVWRNTNAGTEQDFITSLTGPIGPTGPMMFGDTGELEVVGQTIKALVDNKDIEIVTKGAGNLLFKIDRDGWVLKYGKLENTIADICGSGSTLDDQGNIYTTGADYISLAAFVTKTSSNGQIIWQKQLGFLSQGESITFANGFIYIAAHNLTDFGSVFPQIIKMDLDGNIVRVLDFDIHIDGNTSEPDSIRMTEIAVDADENIYYIGSQNNSSVVPGESSLVVGKINTTTNQLDWFKVFNGNRGGIDRGLALKLVNDFVYVSGAIYNDNTGLRYDAFIAKIRKDGVISWNNVIGNGVGTEGLSMTVDINDYIYLAGSNTGSGFNNFYMKLDQNGSTIWCKNINNYGRTISAIEENGTDSIFIISTQATNSTPPRASTDLYLAKISKVDGSITWQQYIYTSYRDSIWGIFLGYPATGHRSLTIDPTGKSVYITGLTLDGGVPYHNSFLMSYDQKSLPEGPYGNWTIEDANFTVSNLSLYNIDSINTTITINDTLIDGSIPTLTESFGDFTISINKEREVTLFSPNTELYVKGIVTIDDLYTLPRKAGTTGQILTYGNSGTLLEWKLPTITFGFNDYQEIANNILGTASMDGIFVDPVLGPITKEFTFGGLGFDDEFFEVALPTGFEVSFMGVSYSTIYVGSNSFITFGDGFAQAGGYTKNNPPLPGIFIGAGDRSCQALYTKETADQFVIRYEGSILPSGLVEPFPEIEWEITFNKNSSILDVNIGNNYTYFTQDGSTFIKNTDEIYKELVLPPGEAFRIVRGYGYRPVQANRLNYINIEGLSYSVIEDPLNLGDDIVSIDFSGLGGSGKFYYQSNAPVSDTTAGIQPGALWYDSDQGYLYVYINDGDTAQWVTQVNNVGPVGPQGNSGTFTTLSSTGSNIFLDSDSDFHILSGIQNGADQRVYTLESFGSDQGMYVQSQIPDMLADQDQILFGLKDSADNWAYYVKLTHNLPTIGNMVIYDAYGSDGNNNVLDYAQIYNPGDMFVIYIDGEKVYFKINGITIQTIDFVVNTSLSYKFFCETVVGTNPANTLSSDYSFEFFKFYPTVSISNNKNLLPTSTKTADYIVTLNDYVIRVDATGGDVTITLPTVDSAFGNGKGYEFVIKRIDNSGNLVYLNGNSGQLIDTYTTGGLTLNSLETKRVQSNGTTWDIL